MRMHAVVTNNVAEALLRILEFTQRRQRVLIANINRMHKPNFQPRDLPVAEFSCLMNEAINEHIRAHRLLMRDSANVKFAAGGRFSARPVIDNHARMLLESNRDEYLMFQIDKLLENTVNQKIAAKLLRQRQGSKVEFEVSQN